MIYLQLYLIVGVVYTLLNFGYMFDYLIKDLMKEHPVLYLESKQTADNLIREFCLLLVVLWPLAIFKLIRNRISR